MSHLKLKALKKKEKEGKWWEEYNMGYSIQGSDINIVASFLYVKVRKHLPIDNTSNSEPFHVIPKILLERQTWEFLRKKAI